MKAVFLDTDSLGRDFSLRSLEDLPVEWIFYQNANPSDIGDAEIVVTNKKMLSREVLVRAPKLKLICVAATGYNNIDVQAAKELNVVVCNSPAYSTSSVAQMTLCLMLALMTRFVDYAKAAKERWFKSDQFCILDYPIFELKGKKLGMIGYGAIGQEVARLAKAFGMEVLIAQHKKMSGAIPFADVLRQSDLVTIHTPLTEQTRNLISGKELEMMKRSAFLINVARGGVVNEQDLVKALREKKIAGAACDVLSVEPPKKDHPLLQPDVPNLILTPHIAWASLEARETLIQILKRNILSFLNGHPTHVILVALFVLMGSCFAQDHRNWDVNADLLYWHVGESGTIPNSTLSVSGSPDFTTMLNLNNFNFGWDFGCRIGGRYYNLGCDEWGVSLNYTGFRADAKKNGALEGLIGIPSGFPMTGTLTDTNFLNLFWLFAAESYQSRWDLKYNLFDLEVDHEYRISCALSMRPYIGVKGGWIDQDLNIHSIYINPLANNARVFATEVVRNHFWGVGPRCGLNSKWNLGNLGCHSFHLFGDLSGAFMWSSWTVSDVLTIDSTVTGDLKVRHRYAGSLMLQDLLGLEWSIRLNDCGRMFSLRAGYEAQYWFDQLQIFNAYNGRQHNALTLQGGTFDLRFNY